MQFAGTFEGVRNDGSALTPEGAASSLLEGGMSGVRRSNSPQYKARLMECARIYERLLKGNRWDALRFQEAMTISDFPNLFGDILDRQMLANYMEVKYAWRQYCKAGTIQDFRQAKRFRIDRGAGVFDGPVNATGTAPGAQIGGDGSTGIAQVAEYPEGRRTDGVYTLQLYKYGRRMPFAWETIINDDLDALKDTPAMLARGARRTEEKKVTELYMTSAGPNTSFFNVANKNVLKNAVNSAVTVDNSHLTITALQQALIIMMSQVDLDGEPITIDAVTLVVPPSLKVVAMNILNASQVWMNDQGGTLGTAGSGATASEYSLQRLLADNWAKNIVKLAVNYYQPIVDTTYGNTAWYLFADPNNGRPALEMAFLRGHEMPELFMKLPNQVAIGEGSIGPGPGPLVGTNNMNPLEGDFDTDAIHYKCRHIMGGTTLDPICAVASTGQN